MTLTSPHSPVLKKIRRAVAHGGLTDDGLAVVEGPKLIAEALRSSSGPDQHRRCKVSRVFAVEGVDAPAGVAPDAVTWVTEKLFREIKVTSGQSQGILALVEAPVWTLADVLGNNGPILALDAIQDPGNAGTMIRTAEAFGASAVALLEGCVDPWNPKCIRASAGSVFRMPVVRVKDPVAELQGRDWLAASGDAATTIDVVDWKRPAVLFVGNEGSGVRREIAAKCKGVRIPTESVESLNAAVAAAVILFESYRQRL